MKKNIPGSVEELSVVVPAYNAASWLPKSVPKTIEAIQVSGIKKAEIVVVDDGSSDKTTEVAESLSTKNIPVRVVRQENSGRFIARDTGAKSATFKNILFIDTRVFIGKSSLKYLVENARPNDPRRCVWNSQVYINKNSIYARFWEAIAFNAWRKYFINPRRISYGINDFDKYPKGTTCFFIPKKVIIAANEWFKTQTRDLKVSNDDTLLIRGIAKNYDINLSPDFHCFYNSRSSLKQFVKHVYHRGKVFVDGFLRNDGNAYFLPLILFLLLCPIVVVGLIFMPRYIPMTFLAFGVAWLLVLMIMIGRKTEFKDAMSFFILAPVFVLLYAAGIWTAVFRQFVLRKANSK